MDESLKSLHLAVGALMNPARSCGKKIDYRSEETARKAADAMNLKTSRPGYHELEPYPCAHCGGWHIGRRMPEEELKRYAEEGLTLDGDGKRAEDGSTLDGDGQEGE